MRPVQLLADSTCDLALEMIAHYHVDVVPLYVTLDQDSWRDSVDIHAQDIVAYFKQYKQTPKTAAASVADFVQAFTPYVDQEKDILLFTISSGLSATYQNAVIAAQSFPGVTIEVVDSANLSTGIALLICKGADWLAEGLGIVEVAQKLRALTPHVKASFVIETLEFLYKGGRCSAIQAVGASILNLKPCILVENGLMRPGVKYRGDQLRVVKRYVQDVLDGIRQPDTTRAFITYSPSEPGLREAAYEMVTAAGIFQEVHYAEAGCVITSHCGPNTLGVLYIEQPERGNLN